MEKISWTGDVKDEVLDRAKEERKILYTVRGNSGNEFVTYALATAL
jgi:hypothetical protein